MIDLKGHRALVTGSSQGVGRAIALAFAEAGADVIVHGVKADDRGAAVVAECRRFGVKAEFVALDLIGDTVAICERLHGAAEKLLPGIDILANNAGMMIDVPFEQMDMDRFDRTMRLNVYAPYFLTQRFARDWIRDKVPGRVVMTGSINGRLAELDSTAYDTSKGAIDMMVKTLAVSLAPLIRVNGIAPGLVYTPLTSWMDKNPELKKWITHHVPSKAIPDAAVCGPAAVYLCSDAASHVYGQMLLVDGGMSAWQHPGLMK